MLLWRDSLVRLQSAVGDEEVLGRGLSSEGLELAMGIPRTPAIHKRQLTITHQSAKSVVLGQQRQFLEQVLREFAGIRTYRPRKSICVVAEVAAGQLGIGKSIF